MAEEEIKCIICRMLLRTCEKLGNKQICAQAIEELKADKITEEELMKRITSHFDPKKFKETWNQIIDENVEKKKKG